MQTNELIFWHAFASVGGFGAQRFRKLLARFGNLENAWRASREDLLQSGIGEGHAGNVAEFRAKISPEKLFLDLEKENIEIITIEDKLYPPQLKEIATAPAVLYFRGNAEIFANKSVAVVGSRKFTAYGEQVTQSLTRDLVQAGLTIVSGLALGIDGIAHRAALASSGMTIAVLGTGIDDATIYPREHFNLAKEILESGGTLLTEYAPKTPSLKQNFPARNRIMAGLTLGTLVVEAATDSGSLITAGLALEFSREVFAVPGPVFSPQSAGANYLIKNGAKLVESAADVLQELNISRLDNSLPKKIFEPKTKEEKTIWSALGSDPLHVDRISKLTRLNPATVGAILTTLEIEEVVKNVGGQNYIKI